MAARKKVPARKKTTRKATKNDPPKKSLGDIIDERYATRAERLEIESHVHELKKRETELESLIFEMLTAQGIDSAGGKLAKVSKKQTPVGRIEDWPGFLRWCADNEASDCVQRRVNAGSVVERLDEGQRVKGVVIEYLPKLSLTKA